MEQLKHFRKALDHLGEGVFILDEGGNGVYLNPRGARMLGTRAMGME